MKQWHIIHEWKYLPLSNDLACRSCSVKDFIKSDNIFVQKYGSTHFLHSIPNHKHDVIVMVYLSGVSSFPPIPI